MFLVLVWGFLGFLGFLKFFGGFSFGVFYFDFGFVYLFLFSFFVIFDFDCCCILYSTSLSSYVEPDDGRYGRNM